MQSLAHTLRHTFYKAGLLTILICSFLFSSQILLAEETIEESVTEKATTKEKIASAQQSKSSGGMIDRSNQEKTELTEKNTSNRASRAQQRTITTSWIHNAEFEYLIDNDGDGFYHRFRVTFDADTHLISDRIYAKLYLDNNTEERLYYVTDDFSIIGEALSDSYEVSTSLTDGYDSDIYNLRIAIFDAVTHEQLDSINAYDDSDLYGRYLEQVDYDSQQSTVFTIQELTVALSGDVDQDGYFPELEITLDADVSFGSEWVELSVFIVDQFNEETSLYRSGDLLITGYQNADKDISTISLDTGYSSGLYHIRAELRESSSGILLATADTTRSVGLAVESKDYDGYYENYGAESEGHGGAFGWFGIVGLLVMLRLRKK